MATSGGVGFVRHALLNRIPLFAVVPMHVVSRLFNQLVGVRVQVDAIHALNMRPWNCVPQVADHRVDDEHLAMLVEIEAPRVCHSMHNGFDGSMLGMISPDTCIDVDPLRIASAWFANIAGRLDSVASIEPTIGSPLETVGWCMPDDSIIEAIEDDLGWTIGNIVAICIRKEKQLW